MILFAVFSSEGLMMAELLNADTGTCYRKSHGSMDLLLPCTRWLQVSETIPFLGGIAWFK